MSEGPGSVRPIACVAALHAAVQGLAGVVLGVLALCMSFCALGPAPQLQGNGFSQHLAYYLQGGQGCGAAQDYGLYTDAVTRPAALRVWLVVSLIFSVAMLAASVVLVLAVWRRLPDERCQVALVCWLMIMVFTSLDDLVLSYVVGSDFLASMSDLKESVGPMTLAFLLLVAARGVYLWLTNVALTVFLFRKARKLHLLLRDQKINREQTCIDSWPTLEGQPAKSPSTIPVTLPQQFSESQIMSFPEYSARTRWATINGLNRGLRGPSRPAGESEAPRRASTSTYRQGVDNQTFNDEKRLYLYLQNDVGSSRDFEESVVGWHYPQKEEPPVPIPPVDYLDDIQEVTTPENRIPMMNLHEAILDRTLRLKKVPDELKRGLQNF